MYATSDMRLKKKRSTLPDMIPVAGKGRAKLGRGVSLLASLPGNPGRDRCMMKAFYLKSKNIDHMDGT